MELTLLQEKQAIRYLRHNMDLFIASGSSRAVFSVDNDLKEILNIKTDVPCIIKMSLGIGGYRQSKREYEVFKYMGERYLAEIFARGSILTVMEQVDTDWDFYEFYEYNNCDVEDHLTEIYGEETDTAEYQKNYKIYSAAAEVVYALEDYLGTTADNAQIGVADSGRVVAYDYGFDSDVYACDQMTRTSDYFSYGEEETDLFFELLLNTISEEMSLGFDYLDENDFITIEDNYYCLVNKD